MVTGERELGRVAHLALAAVPLVLGLIVGCALGAGDDDDGEVPAPGTEVGDTGTATEPEDLVMEADDFVALADMTPVRGFFLANPLGHLDEALAVADDPAGGVYPVGTVIQLIPQEAMVKRADGFAPETNDWEFFFLEVSEDGTEILDRGTDQVVNQFDLACADCHQQAEPQFDFVCEQDHGCAPLPIDRDVIEAVQCSDPRPSETVLEHCD
jgi:hypothetical protein